MRKEDFNIMANIKMIEELKANLLCLIGDLYTLLTRGSGIEVKYVRKEDFNIMANIKMIEELKANLLCLIGDLYTLLTRGTNIARDSILNCISGAILILYVLAQKLGYSCNEVDDDMKKKLKIGITARDSILNCISGAILILYVLAQKLGYSCNEVDDDMKKKLKIGITEEHEYEREGKNLSKLQNHIKQR